MQIYLLLTEKCNLSCSMCIRGNKNNIELTLEEIKKIQNLDELFSHQIVITGGEPTLCRDYSKIVDFFSSNAKSVSICTNGTNKTIFDKNIHRENVIVQISIDGTEYYHNKIRGQGTYKLTMDNVFEFEQRGIPYTISTVVGRQNIENMKDLADELSKLKAMKCWSVSFEMPFGHADKSLIIPLNEWNVFVDKMLNYVPFRMKIRKLFPFELIKQNQSLLDGLQLSKICSNCGSGSCKIYVYPDLTVYPCTCLTDFPLGNLNHSSLYSILKSPLTMHFSNYSVAQDSICSKCEYLNYCNGGCIGMSYTFFHKLGYGDIRCPKISK